MRGVISATESESEESEHFHFLRFRYDSIVNDAVKTTLLELEAETEEPTNHKSWKRRQ